MGFFSQGLKQEFETAMVNKPSVFEPLKFYCSYCQKAMLKHGGFLEFHEYMKKQNSHETCMIYNNGSEIPFLKFVSDGRRACSDLLLE